MVFGIVLFMVNFPDSLIKRINWIISKPTRKELKNVKVRIRHLGELIPASITISASRVGSCKLKRKINGLADGQSAVIYKRNIMLGGGEIRFR